MEYNLNVTGKKIIIISGLLIAISVPLTLSLVRQQSNKNTQAAAPDKLEAEGGVLGGNATPKTDPLASGGQYVAFSNQTPTPTPLSGLKYPPDTTSMTPKSVSSLARPGYLTPVTEPTFGTKLTRVTDPSAFSGSTTIRHHYSKDSAWNRDGSKMLMGKYLLDGKTYKVIKLLPVGGEFRWSNTDPDKIYMIQGSGAFQSYNLATDTFTTIRQLSGYNEILMGPWEGNISNDDGFVVLSGRNGTDYTVIVFNIKSNTIVSTKTFPGKWDAGIDWASISPSGKYVVINHSYCNPSCAGNVESYDLNMNYITEIAPKGEHGDLVTDVDGNDYFVYVGGGANYYITKTRVDTGAKTSLVSIQVGGHISCRNILRPGWCYGTISGYKEAIGFKLDGSGTVERFAHHRSTESNYDTQTKGVVSMDGTKMLWTSDWGYTDGSFFDYIAESY